MFQKIIGYALGQLFKYLSPEMVKEFVDAGLDKIEDRFIKGEVDTAQEEAIRGAIDLIRKIMGIEDKRYGTDKT